MVWYNDISNAESSLVSILMENGDGGTFQPAVSYKVDIVSNSGSNMISVLLGRGRWYFYVSDIL
ncbi:MAG: hypothetical protein MRQ07_01225 [Candidatus Midichloria sp.]|nr:hypothetical protein [Candidatus Midichloria sp.]